MLHQSPTKAIATCQIEDNAKSNPTSESYIKSKLAISSKIESMQSFLEYKAACSTGRSVV
jgi:hypothetical protein